MAGRGPWWVRAYGGRFGTVRRVVRHDCSERCPQHLRHPICTPPFQIHSMSVPSDAPVFQTDSVPLNPASSALENANIAAR
jgi:hypothetical protein